MSENPTQTNGASSNVYTFDAEHRDDDDENGDDGNDDDGHGDGTANGTDAAADDDAERIPGFTTGAGIAGGALGLEWL